MDTTQIGKSSALAIRPHSSTVLSMRVRIKLTTSRVNQDEDSARAVNASIMIVDYVHRLIY